MTEKEFDTHIKNCTPETPCPLHDVNSEKEFCAGCKKELSEDEVSYCNGCVQEDLHSDDYDQAVDRELTK